MSEIDLSQLKSAQKNLWLVSIGSCGGFARADDVQRAFAINFSRRGFA